jgi:dTDP-4-dehydrorhamnose 3,5-epimerase-like enzyme
MDNHERNLSPTGRHSGTGTVGRRVFLLGESMKIEHVQLRKHGDNGGMLVALEQGRNVPFEIRRVYYIFGTKAEVRRGRHAHRNLTQMAVAVRGSVTFLLDDGTEPVEVMLNDPSRGLLLNRMVWRELYDFSEDCVLMVLADQLYDPGDYITDYGDFVRELGGSVESERMAACLAV